MYPIDITGKRSWRKGGKYLRECNCNGNIIGVGFEGKVLTTEGKEWMEKSMKNTCKLIKCFGVTGDEIAIKSNNLNMEERKMMLECELPEWDEAINSV